MVQKWKSKFTKLILKFNFNILVFRDYKSNPELDEYEADGIDERSFAELDIGERNLVDQELDRRNQLGFLPGALINDGDQLPHHEDDFEFPSSLGNIRNSRLPQSLESSNKFFNQPANQMQYGADEDLPYFTTNDISQIKTDNLAEWINMEAPRRGIRRQFEQFLTGFTDEHGSSVYGDKVRLMVENNLESLEVSFMHLTERDPFLAYILGSAPKQVLPIFDDVALEVVFRSYPSYDQVSTEVHVRITDLPLLYSLRELRQYHLDTLVRVFGVVSRRSNVLPQLKYVKYTCTKCGVILGPFYQDPSNPQEVKVGSCWSCQSKGPFQLSSQSTVYRNYQKITLQETPGSVLAGRLPRHREVILLWDLVDFAKPGEEVEIIGIYQNSLDVSLNNQHGFPVFSTVIEANTVIKKHSQNSGLNVITEQEAEFIRNLAKDPNIGKRIIQSIAPSIYGHKDIKTAIALALFGGCGKDVNNKHNIRGDINVLLLGDPGVAKSQFLKFAEQTAERCIYATGQGASAVGLTASVRKDPVTREWTLEGGALVLADQGTCLIDEFDKMNDKDRTSIHEAMEQQSISISKAGIVTSLRARCSVIAAANPLRGRYNPTLPLIQNVDLTEPILSRFDLVHVIRDTVDPVSDFDLAKFVLDSHDRSHSSNQMDMEVENSSPVDALSPEILKKYISYAREHCKPVLYQMDQDKLTTLYSELRAASLSGGGLPITVRHLESIIRMSESHAKMHLRDHVRQEDVDFAIATFLNSFIASQKVSISKLLSKALSKYLNRGRDRTELLQTLLNRLVRETLHFNTMASANSQNPQPTQPETVQIKVQDFSTRARDLGATPAQIFEFLKEENLSRIRFELETDSEGNRYLIKRW
jgi:DNA replication licensing factor MCM2